MDRKVLFIHHARTMGGATVSLGILASQLAMKCAEVRILLVDPTSEVRGYLEARGLVVDEFRARVVLDHTTASTLTFAYPFQVWRHLSTIFRARHEWVRIHVLYQSWIPDVVHLNSVVLAPLIRPLKECGFPVVWHIREAPTRGAFGLRTWWMKKQIRSLMDATIFIGPQYQQAWLKKAGGRIIYNTIDAAFELAGTQRVRETAMSLRQDNYGRNVKRPVVFGFLGGVSEIKGTLPLLRAWKDCQWNDGEAILLLAGMPDHHDLSHLGKLARRVLPLVGMGTYWQRCQNAWTSLPGSVERLQFASDLTSFFLRIDVLVFPATRDHFPRPVIEAAAFGVPVIGSDLPSIVDVLKHEATGLIVPVADEREWSRALRRVVADPRQLQQWGVNSYRLYREVFSTEKALQSLMEVYAAVSPR